MAASECKNNVETIPVEMLTRLQAASYALPIEENSATSPTTSSDGTGLVDAFVTGAQMSSLSHLRSATID